MDPGEEGGGPRSPILERLSRALAGSYEVIGEIGSGGMATVYAAADVKHARKVALKVLRPDLSAMLGAERFFAEIETTAKLQHPHILPLHDSGSADGLLYYVMPFVDGESLRQRLDREGQLPVEEATRIAVVLAGALAHAHRRGVIHRDLKPANILLQDGEPVMADFGIALAVDAAGGSRLTETGLSVGTPHYMSPEQATGDRQVGPASDVYALGCVLYEMLVGEPPFQGRTVQAILGRIITGDVTPASKLRATVPRNVDAAIDRALEKLPADRFASADRFAEALQDPAFGYDPAQDVALGGVGAKTWRRRAGVAALVALASVAVAAFTAVRVPSSAAPVARYGMLLPDGHRPLVGVGSNVAVSPDGDAVVYVGPGTSGTQLWLRSRNDLDPVALSGTTGARSPSFSPDGLRVAFTAGSSIRITSLAGQPPITVLEDGAGGNAVAWGDDGYLYFDDTDLGLARMLATGGALEEVSRRDVEAAELFHGWVDPLPNGRGVLMTVGYEGSTQVGLYRIVAIDLDSGERRSIVPGVVGRYARSGHLVYVSAEGELLAAPFDQDRMELTGSAIALGAGVGVGLFGSVGLSISADGTAVYAPAIPGSDRAQVVRISRAGDVMSPDPDWQLDLRGGGQETALSVSPDGTRLAIALETARGSDIWIKQLDRGPLARLTFEEGMNIRPRWSADGRTIYYVSNRLERGLHFDAWARPADGSGSPRLLADLDESIAELQVAPDASSFAMRVGARGDQDIVGGRPGSDGIFPIEAGTATAMGVALSPSGRWVAYASDETGFMEIYVRPYPDVEAGRWQVSLGGGSGPVWAKDEREILHVTPNGEIGSIAVRTSGLTLEVVERRTLFRLPEIPFGTGTNYAGWDVAPDGEAFFFVLGTPAPSTATHLVVIQNLFAMLAAREPS
jgi:eukaryotic-like serine/threonine-protein kinase